MSINNKAKKFLTNTETFAKRGINTENKIGIATTKSNIISYVIYILFIINRDDYFNQFTLFCQLTEQQKKPQEKFQRIQVCYLIFKRDL